MRIHKKIIKVVCIAIVLAVMMPVMSAFAAATATITGAGLNVYRDPYLTQYWATVPAGYTVNVNASIAGVSQISLYNRIGYCETESLTFNADPADVAIVKTKTTQATRVYRSANIRSAYVTVPAGFEVEVLAVAGVCARVRRGVYIGYAYTGHLEAYQVTVDPAVDEKYNEEVNKVDATGITSLEGMISSGYYSNEQIIFAFAVKKMGYNAAAASGLIANIKVESNFRPGAVGDSGTSIGICQWHASRKTRLVNYCKSKGYDSASLEGQLWYLKYELETYYPSVNRYMLSVPDNAGGAYDAGYYFCYNFEAPANRVAQSKNRATSAQNTYYPKYAGYVI